MIVYVLVCDKVRKYVARAGWYSVYAKYLRDARTFESRVEAEAEACEDERVVMVQI
jgi:hypothetical protein